MYTYENNDDIGNDAKQLFKVDYFLKIDLRFERFEQYTRFSYVLGFLSNIGSLRNKNDDEL